MSVLAREPRALAFGLLHTVSATIGQTFVISLFLPGIKASFALGDAQVALLFTLTTVASAAALWKVGPWIDRTDVVRYSLWCGLLLVVACVTMALARELIVLVLGLFCLRLGGNGLLTHVALTATARHFTRERGKALSLVLLGSSIGEAGLPAPLVTMIAAFGWRPTLALTGCLGLLLVLHDRRRRARAARTIGICANGGRRGRDFRSRVGTDAVRHGALVRGEHDSDPVGRCLTPSRCNGAGPVRNVPRRMRRHAESSVSSMNAGSKILSAST